MILCADIGATKTLMGLAVPGDGKAGIQVVATQRYLAAQLPSFDEILNTFLRDHASTLTSPLQAACFGIAGPVTGEVVQMTNLPWRLDAQALSRQLGGIPVRLVNDFKAAASGIDALQPEELLCLQEGTALDKEPQLVIGAGSGLGVAFRVWRDHAHGDGGYYHVVPGEGGHVGFSPVNAEQDRAVLRLRQHVPRVVVEHFVSGPGLANLYNCLDQDGDHGAPVDAAHPFPLEVATAQNTEGLTGEEVFRRATEEQDPRALHALHHFLLSYGMVAGDHALAVLARGGVYLAGGIAQKCGPLMQDGRFLVGFRHKGPYSELMATLPVHVVMQPDLGLLGAAVLGRRLITQ